MIHLALSKQQISHVSLSQESSFLCLTGQLCATLCFMLFCYVPDLLLLASSLCAYTLLFAVPVHLHLLYAVLTLLRPAGLLCQCALLCYNLLCAFLRRCSLQSSCALFFSLCCCIVPALPSGLARYMPRVNAFCCGLCLRCCCRQATNML